MTAKHNDQIFKDFGNKLKTHRDKAKMTQSEVAKAAEIHVNYYARMERGEENPTLEVLHKLKKVLKMESDIV